VVSLESLGDGDGNILHDRIGQKLLTGTLYQLPRMIGIGRLDRHLDVFADAHVLQSGHVETVKSMLYSFPLHIKDGAT
jgi:hypothetical protein